MCYQLRCVNLALRILVVLQFTEPLISRNLLMVLELYNISTPNVNTTP